MGIGILIWRKYCTGGSATITATDKVYLNISTRCALGRGTRGRGRGRGGARAGSSASGHMPAREILVSPVTETGSHDQAIGDDALSQAMLRVLERVVGARTGSVARGSTSKRLQYNGAKIFRGVSGVAPNVKLKGAVSLLRDEAYQWWLTVREGTKADRLTWDFFKTSFQGKYVGASYVNARRKEFLNLTQGNRTVAAYEVEFLRLSCYAREIVATEYELEKANIAEDVKHSESQNCEKYRGRGKRDFRSLGSTGRPIKRAKVDRPVRAGDPIVATRPQPCADCGRSHLGKCWKKIRACFRCWSMDYQGHVQPVRGGQPLRGRGQARSGNGFERGRGAPGRGTGNTEVRQPALVYAARRERMLGIKFESTVSEITVLSPLGQSVRVNKLFKDVPLEVQGEVFPVNLMGLPFREFDIILGIDWLVKHRVRLDCAAKWLVLRTLEDG
ncbi:uncharacterized protein [Gossypium hirsutum]|uniref:Retrotransposon gag domain-containing protein n=1 Tax=Gossypium hirsutum TaxID=3635 RepID=A0A1U8PYM4_GOSHI|nr:uncharacterized protein LOC107963318 [Gossypium hirsutum]